MVNELGGSAKGFCWEIPSRVARCTKCSALVQYLRAPLYVAPVCALRVIALHAQPTIGEVPPGHLLGWVPVALSNGLPVDSQFSWWGTSMSEA